ncbi:hypothetical protein WG66_012280 [Moniliophthora roreri]|nr:hypothetical protein WG66_012280 [Moniliophthora roreri]
MSIGNPQIMPRRKSARIERRQDGGGSSSSSVTSTSTGSSTESSSAPASRTTSIALVSDVTAQSTPASASTSATITDSDSSSESSTTPTTTLSTTTTSPVSASSVPSSTSSSSTQTPTSDSSSSPISSSTSSIEPSTSASSSAPSAFTLPKSSSSSESSTISATTPDFFAASSTPQVSTSSTLTSFATSATPPIPTESSSRVGASSAEGFWSNRGAVAGTFTALALIVLGLLLALVLFVRKRWRSANYRDTIYSDKFPVEPGLSTQAATPSRPTSSSGHESDSEDLHRGPMDGNADYYNYNHHNADPFADIHQPPYPNGSLPEITYSYARDVNNQYPSYDYDIERAGGASTSTSSLSNPSGHQASVAPQSYFNPLNPFNPPPNSVRNSFNNPKPYNQQPYFGRNATSGQAAERDSAAYPPSVDSFYGDPIDPNIGYAR